jgi:mono/diheme cytochrome c family protein
LSRKHTSVHFLLTCVFVLVTTTGCWEQWSEDWFPQMKWQKAVQAFEATGHESAPSGFAPAPGSVPVTGKTPEVGRMDVAAAAQLVNPRDPADYRSLENGREQYGVYCATCHGASGMGDGPVSLTGDIKGPFAGVFPLVGLVTARSDGYIYNVIRLGNGGVPGLRMPSYRRIPETDRWDIVNYVRFLDSKGGSL